MLAQTTNTPHTQSNESEALLKYASKSSTAEVLHAGLAYRKARLEQPDMITTDKAADLLGTSRVTINAWIKSGRCFAVAGATRGFKLAVWQFEPALWPAIPSLVKVLGTDGWTLLSFLESPHAQIDHLVPKDALNAGDINQSQLLELAYAEAH